MPDKKTNIWDVINDNFFFVFIVIVLIIYAIVGKL